MGTFQADYLIVESSTYDNYPKGEERMIKKIDSWIKKQKKFTQLFFKSQRITNGGYDYFMGWDGSKEGWETSEEADECRRKFIEFVKSVSQYCKIIRIRPSGDVVEEGYLVEESFEKDALKQDGEEK